MIYQNSRYYHQTIDFLSFFPNENQYPIVFYQFDDPSVTTWHEHTYVQGERLDQISQKYYKRPDFWWLIPEYNPQIVDFTNITPGTVLRVPRV